LSRHLVKLWSRQMDISLQKTIVFIFFIFIGFLLKTKLKSNEEIAGIKKIILNLALPATIFIALLGVEVELGLLLLPLLALALNLLMFLVFPFILPFLGIKRNTAKFRTASLLVPSLAPGLSCFPFVLEFLGEDYLAKAAMADLGNKIFVLVFLYVVAMALYFRLNGKTQKNKSANIVPMLKAMVSEPVNIFIIVALLLLVLGLNMNSLPFVFSETLQKLSLIMTPLVLLFIGLAVKIKRNQFFQIFSLLVLRAGVVFLIAGLVVLMSGLQIANDILLLLAFGLSACSFWPYAHISAVDALESNTGGEVKTFDSNYAISVLALSFPLSTVLILGVLNSGQLLTNVQNIFLVSLICCAIGCIRPIKKAVWMYFESRKLQKADLEPSSVE